jgi:hypothetical protein
MFKPQCLIFQDTDPRVNWEALNRGKLAKARTSEIDYQCEFIDGACKTTRKRDRLDKQCCCRGCKKSRGYISYAVQSDVDEMQQYWDDKLGFWREGKGCLLPRSLRSPLCLDYRCGPFSVKEQPYRELVDTIDAAAMDAFNAFFP